MDNRRVPDSRNGRRGWGVASSCASLGLERRMCSPVHRGDGSSPSSEPVRVGGEEASAGSVRGLSSAFVARCRGTTPLRKIPERHAPGLCGASRARGGSPSKNSANAKYTRDAGRSPRFERERGRRWAPTHAPSEEHRGCFGKKDHTGTRTSSGKKYVAVHHRSPTPAQTSGCRASTLEERDGLRPFRLPRRVSANPRTPRGGGS